MAYDLNISRVQEFENAYWYDLTSCTTIENNIFNYMNVPYLGGFFDT